MDWALAPYLAYRTIERVFAAEQGMIFRVSRLVQLLEQCFF